MTVGKPMNLIITFAIPMLIGNIFQQIYNVVDTIVVGRYLGENALAGVGSTGTLTGLLFALVFGMCNGGGLIIAQSFGCRDFDTLKKAVTAMIWVAGIMTVLLSIIGLSASRFLLTILAVPEDVIEYSVTYLRILYAFVFGSVIYNGASAILRSIGDSKTPLIALIISSLVNVCLDLVFVVVLRLGVAGVAYATILAQCVSAVIAVGFLYKKRREIGLCSLLVKPERHMVSLVIRTGLPAALQSGMISLGGLSVQRLINSFGASVMAAYVAANRIDSVAIQVIVSIGTALSVFTGQNMGKNDFKRIANGLYHTMAVMVGASALIAGIVLTFRYPLIYVFLGDSATDLAIETGVTYLSIIGIAYVIAGVMNSYLNVIRGAGDVNTCLVAGIAELSGRIVFAYLLSHFLGATGIWIATPISWGCGCIIPVVRYYSGKWKTKKLIS